jgi:hypothetical protein
MDKKKNSFPDNLPEGIVVFFLNFVRLCIPISKSCDRFKNYLSFEIRSW